MNILTIPLSCARQKWPRTLMLLCVFLLGFASITALYKVSVAVGEGFEKKLTSFGANIIISPKKETLTVSYGGIPLGDMSLNEGYIPVGQALAAIDSIALKDRIAIKSPKLVGLARLDGKPVPLVGVDFEQEVELKQFWSVLGTFPGGATSATMPLGGSNPLAFIQNEHSSHPSTSPEATQPSGSGGTSQNAAHISGSQTGKDHAAAPGIETLAGSSLARRLGFEPGASFTLVGHVVKLSGVLTPTGSDDDNVLFVPLSLAQNILQAHEGASFIEVAALCSACPIEDIVAQLSSALPDLEVKALRQVVAQRMYAIRFAQELALLVALVILCSACAMVIVSMLASVNERRGEIGILRAVGFSRGRIFVIFAAEALGIGLLAGAVGYGLGCVAGRHILTTLNIEAATLPPASFPELAVCAAVAALLAVLAAAFPAWRAGRIDPAQALASL